MRGSSVSRGQWALIMEFFSGGPPIPVLDTEAHRALGGRKLTPPGPCPYSNANQCAKVYLECEFHVPQVTSRIVIGKPGAGSLGGCAAQCQRVRQHVQKLMEDEHRFLNFLEEPSCLQLTQSSFPCLAEAIRALRDVDLRTLLWSRMHDLEVVLGSSKALLMVAPSPSRDVASLLGEVRELQEKESREDRAVLSEMVQRLRHRSRTPQRKAAGAAAGLLPLVPMDEDP